MRDVVKTDLAKALCNPKDPHNVTVDDLYPHYAKFWDQCCDKWHRLLGNKEPEYRDRAIVMAIADALHERDEHMAALEARVAAIETPVGIGASVGEPETTTASVGETATVTLPACDYVAANPKGRIDMRTRAGREIKKQTETAGV